MGFEKLVTLDTDGMVTIGGKDKKTGEANPKTIEGYFLGTKAVGKNKFNKSKTDYKHILLTKSGNVGVWGKTHLDRQMLDVVPGTMVRITYNGTKDVGKGNPMTCYLVEVDQNETIAVNVGVNTPIDSSEDSDHSESEDEEELEAGEEETPADETSLSRARPPQRATQPASAAQQSKVKALLGGKSRSA